MTPRASKLVRDLEDENERLTHENWNLKIIIYRLVSKHGAEIDQSPLDASKVDMVANSSVFLGEHGNAVQILN